MVSYLYMCALANPSLSHTHNPCSTFSRTAQLEKPVFVAMVKIEGIVGKKPLVATALMYTHREISVYGNNGNKIDVT